MTGFVKWFDEKKGYGFISSCRDGSPLQVFVHAQSIVRKGLEPRVLYPGDEVEFDSEEAEKGLRARNVNVVKRMNNYPQRHD